MQAKTSVINRPWSQTGSGLSVQLVKKKRSRTSYTGVVKFKGQSVTQKYRTVFK